MAEWERFLFTYLVSGIPDAVALGEVCDTVDIDALVHLELATIVQRHRYYDRAGPIPAANRVTVRAWMFDCVTAQPLWELSSHGEIVRYTMRSGLPPEVSQPPPVVEGVKIAVEKLLPRLP